MLTNYSLEENITGKLGDPGIPTIPCTINNTYAKFALCDLGACVSVMPFSLYKRLNLINLRLLLYIRKYLIRLLL